MTEAAAVTSEPIDHVVEPPASEPASEFENPPEVQMNAPAIEGSAAQVSSVVDKSDDVSAAVHVIDYEAANEAIYARNVSAPELKDDPFSATASGEMIAAAEHELTSPDGDKARGIALLTSVVDRTANGTPIDPDVATKMQGLQQAVDSYGTEFVIIDFLDASINPDADLYNKKGLHGLYRSGLELILGKETESDKLSWTGHTERPLLREFGAVALDKNGQRFALPDTEEGGKAYAAATMQDAGLLSSDRNMTLPEGVSEAFVEGYNSFAKQLANGEMLAAGQMLASAAVTTAAQSRMPQSTTIMRSDGASLTVTPNARTGGITGTMRAPNGSVVSQNHTGLDYNNTVNMSPASGIATQQGALPSGTSSISALAANSPNAPLLSGPTQANGSAADAVVGHLTNPDILSALMGANSLGGRSVLDDELAATQANPHLVTTRNMAGDIADNQINPNIKEGIRRYKDRITNPDIVESEEETRQIAFSNLETEQELSIANDVLDQMLYGDTPYGLISQGGRYSRVLPAQDIDYSHYKSVLQTLKTYRDFYETNFTAAETWDEYIQEGEKFAAPDLVNLSDVYGLSIKETKEQLQKFVDFYNYRNNTSESMEDLYFSFSKYNITEMYHEGVTSIADALNYFSDKGMANPFIMLSDDERKVLVDIFLRKSNYTRIVSDEDEVETTSEAGYSNLLKKFDAERLPELMVKASSSGLLPIVYTGIPEKLSQKMTPEQKNYLEAYVQIYGTRAITKEYGINEAEGLKLKNEVQNIIEDHFGVDDLKPEQIISLFYKPNLPDFSSQNLLEQLDQSGISYIREIALGTELSALHGIIAPDISYNSYRQIYKSVFELLGVERPYQAAAFAWDNAEFFGLEKAETPLELSQPLSTDQNKLMQMMVAGESWEQINDQFSSEHTVHELLLKIYDKLGIRELYTAHTQLQHVAVSYYIQNRIAEVPQNVRTYHSRPVMTNSGETVELSEMQEKVLRLKLEQGLSNPAIGRELGGITASTVAQHILKAKNRLGFETNPDMYQYLRDIGFVDQDN
jgi:DNA-binding NarL/FixJ family response regulator